MYKQEEYYWWHVGERELFLALLKQYLEKNAGLKLIDMGCGTGKMMEELREFGEVSGIDFSSEALYFCRKRGHKFLYKVDLSLGRFPLKNDSFDIALALDVLEHLKNERAFLKEVFRVLKRGGLLIISVPAYQFMWSYWDETASHQRRYDKNSLSLKLKKRAFPPQGQLFLFFCSSPSDCLQIF